MSDPLVDALTIVADPNDEEGGFRTRRELALESGIGERAVHRRMTQLHEEGRIECRWVVRPSMDGRRMRVPAYRMKS